MVSTLATRSPVPEILLRRVDALTGRIKENQLG